MNVRFVRPLSSKQVGGLKNAIESLRAALQQQGVSVLEGGNPDDADAVHHFHGLWDRTHSKLALTLRKRRMPYLVSPHGMLEPWAWKHKRWKKWPYFHLIEKPFLESAQCLLATSENEAVNLRKLLPPTRCEVIPLGLTSEHRADYSNARDALGWNPDELILLFLSRIHPKKGLDLLLGALTRLKCSSRPKRTRLVIVGGGTPDYENRLKARIDRDRDALPAVEWLGEIWDERKWLYFQGADLFCLPSHSENFGLSVLEALQVGTRVLTTDQTPWTWIEDRGAGWVASASEDRVESALRGFFEQTDWSEEERQSLSDATHSRFSWDHIGPQYLKLYRDLGTASKHRRN